MFESLVKLKWRLFTWGAVLRHRTGIKTVEEGKDEIQEKESKKDIQTLIKIKRCGIRVNIYGFKKDLV